MELTLSDLEAIMIVTKMVKRLGRAIRSTDIETEKQRGAIKLCLAALEDHDEEFLQVADYAFEQHGIPDLLLGGKSE